MRWTAAWVVGVLLLAPACGDHGTASAPGWLDPDLLELAIELPQIPNVEGDETEDAEDAEDAWRSVALLADGTVLGPLGANGKRLAFPLGAEDDPGAQDDAIQMVHTNLREATGRSRLVRETPGTSRVRLLIYADRRVEWKYVQWVMQACAHPGVQIVRLAFAVRGAGEGAPLMRFDSELPKKHAEPTETLKFTLFRRDFREPDKACTVVRLNESPKRVLPRGWGGRAHEEEVRVAAYDAVLADMKGQLDPTMNDLHWRRVPVVGKIVAPPPNGRHVPHGDVMEMVGLLRRLAITEVVYDRAPKPLISRERAAPRAGGK